MKPVVQAGLGAAVESCWEVSAVLGQGQACDQTSGVGVGSMGVRGHGQLRHTDMVSRARREDLWQWAS